MLNRYVARVKAVPPAPGVWMEAPTAESLAGLQKAVDQLATMLRNLGQQPPK
jgi:hypothetical protein